MNMKGIARKLEKISKETAERAVEKSIVIGIYEPEMPAALKNMKRK